jgi:hypothetical protein
MLFVDVRQERAANPFVLFDAIAFLQMQSISIMLRHLVHHKTSIYHGRSLLYLSGSGYLIGVALTGYKHSKDVAFLNPSLDDN